jgi:ribosomal protein S18 acetylase RimI-like enzyme
MSTDLRPAVEGDLGQIGELVSAAYGKYVARIGRKPKPMLANYHAALVEHQLWVVERKQLLAAVLELIPGDDHLLIENVAVNPEFQHNGLGRRLIAFAEVEARRQGFSLVRLYTNALFTENIALYSSLGFRETQREPLNGTTIVHMVKAV